MAKFDLEQAAAVLAVQQVVNEWANELDIDNGHNIAPLLSRDVRYTVGGTTYEGPAAVTGFYEGRLARLGATPEGVPVHRHALSNYRTRFLAPDHVAVEFGLIYFTTAGQASGQDHADPAAFADVRMECRRDDSGEWLISAFDSGQTFRRVTKG